MQDAVETLLVVDDDPIVSELLEDYFTQQGFRVRGASSATEARKLLDDSPPQLVFLDVGLPGEDGLSLARYIREQLDVPIVMVSGAGEPLDRIIGLEVGADDYVTKPFEPRELKARVRSVVRRYRRPVAAPREAGATRIRLAAGREADLRSRQLFDADGAEIALTRMEFDLLQAFVEHPNRPLSRDFLLNLTQNRDWDPFDRSIDIRIARLRRKIEPDPENPVLVRTVRGIGYMFVPPGDSP